MPASAHGSMQASARKCCRAYAAPLLLPRAQNFFDVALDLGTRQHDLMPAALAFDLEIHAYAQYIETVRTAGVRLFHLMHTRQFTHVSKYILVLLTLLLVVDIIMVKIKIGGLS